MQHGSLFRTNIGTDTAFNAVEQEFISGFLEHCELAIFRQFIGKEPGRTLADAQPAVDATVWRETFCLGGSLENEGRRLFGNRDIRAKESHTRHGATGDYLYWFTLEPGLLFNEILNKRS